MRTLILALLVLLPATARADDQELARAHFVTGRSYYDQGRYEDALKEFQEAYRISKRVGFLYNIGVCQEQLGHDDEAMTAYQGYLPSTSDPAEQADVQARIDRLKAKRAAATAPPPAPAPAPSTADNALVASAPPPARAERPVWKRGWFWGVVAGAAVVVAAGVTVGVVVGTRDNGPRTLAPVSLQ